MLCSTMQPVGSRCAAAYSDRLNELIVLSRLMMSRLASAAIEAGLAAALGEIIHCQHMGPIADCSQSLPAGSFRVDSIS